MISELEHFKISIIVPAFNGQERIGDCVDGLVKFFDERNENFEIILAVDGSTDKTLEMAKELSLNHSYVKVSYFPERLGKGGGILYASRLACGNVVIITDVDLSAPPDQIPVLLSALSDGADVVFGSRNHPKSVIIRKPPFYRRLLGKAFNALFRFLFRIKLGDTQCGFKAIRKTVFDELSRDLHVEGFAFDVDLAVKASLKGYRIEEVPIKWGHEEGSKMNVFKQIFSMGKDMLTVWFETRKVEIRSSCPLDTRQFYNSIPGNTYYRARRSIFFPRRFWHSTKNNTIIQCLPTNASYVLDAGCGSGNIASAIAEDGREVCGIDISTPFLKFCNVRYSKKSSWVCADVTRLPLRSRIFDEIICSEVLEHVRHPETALEEFRRVLKPQGSLILTTPNISLRWAILEALWTRVRGNLIEIDHSILSRTRLKLMLVETGFSIRVFRSFMLGFLLLIVAQKNEQKKL